MAEKPQRMTDQESTTMDLEGHQSHIEKLGLASQGSAEGSDVPHVCLESDPACCMESGPDRARVMEDTTAAVWERDKGLGAGGWQGRWREDGRQDALKQEGSDMRERVQGDGQVTAWVRRWKGELEESWGGQ